MEIVTTSHQFGLHGRQRVIVHRLAVPPCEAVERPGLAMIHGGYWSEDSGLGDWPAYFARQGYVVVELGYRLSGDAVWPAQRDDVLVGLGWVRTHAAGFGLDPERVAIVGSSAGGHLAVQLGMFSDFVGGVVALSAPLSPYRAWNDGRDASGVWAEKRVKLRSRAEDLVGCVPERGTSCWDLWVDTVCYQHIVGDEPSMWFGYFSDDLVPVEHGEHYGRRAEAEGAGRGAVEVVSVAGRGHGLSLLGRSEVLEAVEGFLARAVELPPGS